MAAADANGGRRLYVGLVSTMLKPVPNLSVLLHALKTIDGELYFQFSKEEISCLEESFKFSIVLKFLKQRPSLDAIRAFIRSWWGLEGTPMVFAMRCPCNVFIHISSKANFFKALSREACDIDGVTLRFIGPLSSVKMKNHLRF